MRTPFAIVTGCVGMLLTFKLLWSVFGGVPSEYPDVFSWITTVMVYGAAYQLPLSLVLAFAVVLPAERLGRRGARRVNRYALLAGAWLLVAAGSYVVRGVIARHDLATVTILSGLLATGVANSLFVVITRSHDSSFPTMA